MKAKHISRLRRLIRKDWYYKERWRWMWDESDAWWYDWYHSRLESDLTNSIRYRKKAEWYSRKLDEQEK